MGGVWPILACTGLYAPIRGVKIRWTVLQMPSILTFFGMDPIRYDTINKTNKIDEIEGEFTLFWFIH